MEKNQRRRHRRGQGSLTGDHLVRHGPTPLRTLGGLFTGPSRQDREEEGSGFVGKVGRAIARTRRTFLANGGFIYSQN